MLTKYFGEQISGMLSVLAFLPADGMYFQLFQIKHFYIGYLPMVRTSEILESFFGLFERGFFICFS